MIITTIFNESVFRATGTCSSFGGERDFGVTFDEGLALATEYDVRSEYSPLNGLWLPTQPRNTTGLARRLNQWAFYCAMRWDYGLTDIPTLRRSYVVVRCAATHRVCLVRPVDWGPNERTGRVIDLSPGAVAYLGVSTDQVVEAALWIPEL